MSDHKLDNDHKDDGNVWTSYSDMFTSVAIIFLVMFIFAMIKLGVSSLERVAEQKKHQKEMEGLVSKREQKREKENIEKVTKTIEEVSEYKEIIDKKVIELNQFVKKLQQNKKTMQEIIKAQKKKSAMVVSMRKKLVENQEELKSVVQNNKKLKKDIKVINSDLALNKKTVKKLDKIVSKKKEKIADLVKQLEKDFEARKKLKKDMKVVEGYLAESKKVNSEDRRIKEHLQKKLEFKSDKLRKNMVIVEQLQKEVKSSKQHISRLNEVSDDLSEKLQNTSEKLDSEKQKSQKLKSTIAKITSDAKSAAKEASAQFEKKMEELKGQNAGLSSALYQTQNQLRSLQGRYASASSKLSDLNSKLDGKNGKIKGMSEHIGSLQKALGTLSGQVNTMQGELGRTQGQLAGANQSNGELKGSLGEMKGRVNSLTAALEKCDTDIKQKVAVSEHAQKNNQILQNENEKMKEEAAELHNKLKNLSNAILDRKRMQEELKKIAQERDAIKGRFAELDKVLSEGRRNMRASIAKALANKFREANIDVKVNQSTGNVTLLMDENLLFARNSAKLSDIAKEKLSAIIPLYAEVLFENDQIKSKVSSFNVEGHASPTWRGKHVDPEKGHNVAFAYNMELSARRAASINRFIFGQEIGLYKYKYYMRGVTLSVGYGYTRPILKEEEKGIPSRGLASVNEGQDCGPYSCQLSQRVELSFTLEDDLETINKLLKYKNRGIQW
jgi:predicted  nucleic acid-binding Zn-ribbon protein